MSTPPFPIPGSSSSSGGASPQSCLLSQSAAFSAEGSNVQFTTGDIVWDDIGIQVFDAIVFLPKGFYVATGSLLLTDPLLALDARDLYWLQLQAGQAGGHSPQNDGSGGMNAWGGQVSIGNGTDNSYYTRNNPALVNGAGPVPPPSTATLQWESGETDFGTLFGINPAFSLVLLNLSVLTYDFPAFGSAPVVKGDLYITRLAAK